MTIDTNKDVPPISYSMGDIVIVDDGKGTLVKRHICQKSPMLKTWDLGYGESPDWLYSVDYGLGLCSDGFVLQKNILCKANEQHINIVL